MDPVAPSPEALLAQATQAAQAQRWAAVAPLCTQILAAPATAETHAQAHHLLGLFHSQRAAHAHAIHHLQQAVQLLPDNPIFHNNLGEAHRRAGDLPQAEAAYRHALTLAPTLAPAHYNLAITLKARDHVPEALTHFRQAVSLQPTYTQAHYNLANTLMETHQWAAAEEAYRRVLALDPTHVHAHCNLGLTLEHLARPADARAHLQRALALQPDLLTAHTHLAALYLHAGEPLEAVRHYQHAARLDPLNADWPFLIGNICSDFGQVEAAIQAYENAVRLSPDSAEAHNNLGTALQAASKQRLGDAVHHYQEAIRLKPALGVGVYRNLGDALRMQGETAAARAAYAQALTRTPHDRLLQLEYDTLYPSLPASVAARTEMRAALDATLDLYLAESPLPADLTQMHLGNPLPPTSFVYHGQDDLALKTKWARLFRGSFPAPPEPARTNHAKPHIGFLVTQGHEGVFLKCMRGILNFLPGERLRLTITSNSQAVLNQLRQTLTNPALEYLPFPPRFDRAVETLRAAHFDLFYVWELGTDNYSYFLPFCRIAPVQCAGWGWPMTSGIPEVDYYLSCDLVETDAGQSFYSEKLIRLPHLPTYYYRPDFPPGLRARTDNAQFGLPASARLYLCVQHPLKIQPDFDELIAGILRADPHGIMVCVSRADATLPNQLRARWQDTLPDVLPRLHILPRLSVPDYLALVALADVFLDTPGFGGVNTLYDACALGTPFVTLPGTFHRNRWGFALAHLTDTTACIATSPADYVASAHRIAHDPDQRTDLSARLTSTTALFEDLRPVHELADLFIQLTREHHA